MASNFRILFLVLFIVGFCSFFKLWSQSPSYIQGKIYNELNSEVIPFATIVLKKGQLGVYANAEGDFKIIRSARFQSDSLIITSIGYERKALSYNDLDPLAPNDIYLRPTTYKLNEVEVLSFRKKLRPTAIVSKAIRRIRKNYPTNPYSYVSYYREYQKGEEGAYINLNEAIVETSDAGFKELSVQNQYRLLDFKENAAFQRMAISPYYVDTIVSTDYDTPNKFMDKAFLPDQGGNELFILMIHDAIRNFKTGSFSFVNTLATDFIKNHRFQEVSLVYNNAMRLYKIRFEAPRTLIGDSLAMEGDIYIQPEDYSIHKFEYSGYYLIDDQKKEMFSIKTEYGYEPALDSLMCLKYISFNNTFKVVDTSDDSYFKVLKAYWDPFDASKSSLLIELNAEVDPESAANKVCYQILYEGKKVKVKEVDVDGHKLTVWLKDYKKDFGAYKVDVQGLVDVHGRLLYKRKYRELFQYRELFVQEYNQPLSFEESCYLENLPLKQQCLSIYKGDHQYWMNTPEKINNEE